MQKSVDDRPTSCFLLLLLLLLLFLYFFLSRHAPLPVSLIAQSPIAASIERLPESGRQWGRSGCLAYENSTRGAQVADMGSLIGSGVGSGRMMRWVRAGSCC